MEINKKAEIQIPSHVADKAKELGYEVTGTESIFDAKSGDILLDWGIYNGNPFTFKVVKMEEKDKDTILTVEVIDDPESGLPKGKTETFNIHPSDNYDDMYILKPISIVETKLNKRLVKKSAMNQWLPIGDSEEIQNGKCPSCKVKMDVKDDIMTCPECKVKYKKNNEGDYFEYFHDENLDKAYDKYLDSLPPYEVKE